MQKVGVLASAVLSIGAEAFKANTMGRSSPFVGELADAMIIEGDNRSTHRATPVADVS